MSKFADSLKELKGKKDTFEKEKKTGRFCLCGGEVVERFYRPVNFKGRKGVIGPGSRGFSRYGNPISEGFHCSVCGIGYHFLPPKDLLKAKSET